MTLSLAGTSSSLPITNGALSDGRNRMLICTGALAADHTITVTPNDAEKWYFVQNSTTGGFNVIIGQGGGSGSTVSVGPAIIKVVRVDGTGTNANAYDMTPPVVTSITGTANQVNASAATGPVTLSLPQSIGTSSSPTFASVNFSAGTAGSPPITFTGDTNTGIYSSAADTVAVSTGGTLRTSIDSSGLTQVGRVKSSVGACTVEMLAIDGISGTLGTTTADTMTFFTNSATRLQISASSGALTSSTGATLTSGGTWTNASDVALKEQFEPISPAAILDLVEQLPVMKWRYKAEPEADHIGPTAQDFKAAFGLGVSDKGISTVDAIGVLFAAVQALAAEVRKKIS